MESAVTNLTPIGIFDSGYGGLTILKEIKRLLPSYDFIYLGDNARAPYGTRSFDVVYQFTLQAVKYLINRGCRLIILACNTASAKALRTIQQHDLPLIDPSLRVLGVIRPTVEALSSLSATNHIGIFATPGTIASQSYNIEIEKLFPHYITHGHACPMWVPLIENHETESEGAEYFIGRETKSLLAEAPQIDTIILGCTHYPIIKKKIQRHLPSHVKLLEQGGIVAESLKDYLRRHPEIETLCTKNGHTEYLTTEDTEKFDRQGSVFVGEKIKSKLITLQ